MSDQSRIEGRGSGFSSALLLESRAKTWRALGSISSEIRPGMTEEEAHERAARIIRESGMTPNWHRPIVRFGVNTLLGFGKPSAPGIVLGQSDIYFIDIGPVWQGFEGDAGKTFVVGSDPEMHACVAYSERLFGQVKEKWRSERLSGKALYDWASAEAKTAGWVLDLETNGHRISDFPHALHFKGAMTDVGFTPSEATWVLEIQIRHPTRPFGAFFEDILL